MLLQPAHKYVAHPPDNTVMTSYHAAMIALRDFDEPEIYA
jgi:hypothetical protein